ncbi:YutD family protein [Companilactobacillus kimchiensis]|uniref:Transcriptional regulator n=1 Tax=Companilactobacillus kimchiensis TaxID=993692 RepID=A0A0R2LCG0_9LACO|nr:YutD family protein [Companilactobacillus kimchiensis]KRN96317.1 hypothetical protein IV57_GL001922 [Companilactobacillus kimchiensis]
MQEVEDTNTKLVDVIVLADHLITIDKTQYRVVENHDSGFSEERIEERYNNVLDKYDYIVGDWGYDQLRFKGFYEDERKESTLDNRISHLEDYLIEYCNFGCAYFVLEKVKKAPLKNNSHKPKQQKSNHKFRTRTNNHAKAGVKANVKSETKQGNKPNSKQNVKPNKNHTNQKRKAKVSKRRVNNKKKTPTTTTAPAKKTFKIRKIGENNK